MGYPLLERPLKKKYLHDQQSHQETLEHSTAQWDQKELEEARVKKDEWQRRQYRYNDAVATFDGID